MSEKEITDQTAFEIAGIPTPPDAQNVAATDMVSEAVEEIIDDIAGAANGNRRRFRSRGENRI